LQIEYSLLNRECETNGILDTCKQLGVTPVAQSPLKQGLLSDFALERGDDAAMKIKPLLQLLQFLGSLSGGKTIEQTALNYLLCRGAVVIPGAKNAAQMQRNAGALGWRLDENEVEVINEKLQSMGI
jgi:aryl-alcohol dehydrogenase-like predicted oxidoreductase